MRKKGRELKRDTSIAHKDLYFISQLHSRVENQVDVYLAAVLCVRSVSKVVRSRICKPFKETRNRFPAWRNRLLDSVHKRYKYVHF